MFYQLILSVGISCELALFNHRQSTNDCLSKFPVFYIHSKLSFLLNAAKMTSLNLCFDFATEEDDRVS